MSWVCGFMADRFGRVRVMQFTILWFCLFTFIAGFAQNFAQCLGVLRVHGDRWFVPGVPGKRLHG
jgi:MFS family permease